MRGYIIRRLLLMVPTFFLLTIIVFVLMRSIPGDVIDIMLAEMSQAGDSAGIDRAALEHMLGIDEPIYTQYFRWMGILPIPDEGFSGVLQGDLGTSLWKNRPVIDQILPRIPVTVELGVLAIIIGLAIAFPIGIYSAVRQDSIGDFIGRSLAIVLLAVPGFWVGTMVIVFPSIWWQWMPPLEYVSLIEDPLTNLQMFILPAATLGMAMSGGTMRYLRTMMLEVLRQDYVRTAWSKGLRERVVVLRHALKNAFIPVVTLIGLQVPLLVGGSVIIEQIFSLPGMGRLMVDALNARDYTIVSGVNVLLATVVLLNNLVIDLTYGFLDPRIRYQ